MSNQATFFPHDLDAPLRGSIVGSRSATEFRADAVESIRITHAHPDHFGRPIPSPWVDVTLRCLNFVGETACNDGETDGGTVTLPNYDPENPLAGWLGPSGFRSQTYEGKTGLCKVCGKTIPKGEQHARWRSGPREGEPGAPGHDLTLCHAHLECLRRVRFHSTSWPTPLAFSATVAMGLQQMGEARRARAAAAAAKTLKPVKGDTVRVPGYSDDWVVEAIFSSGATVQLKRKDGRKGLLSVDTADTRFVSRPSLDLPPAARYIHEVAA